MKKRTWLIQIIKRDVVDRIKRSSPMNSCLQVISDGTNLVLILNHRLRLNLIVMANLWTWNKHLMSLKQQTNWRIRQPRNSSMDSGRLDPSRSTFWTTLTRLCFTREETMTMMRKNHKTRVNVMILRRTLTIVRRWKTTVWDNCQSSMILMMN